ncbi:hypothetical protein [Sulfurospirillum arcachonense]|uniref:hypothetical protein n=1 Tax=Sulfurospirillum arcachonense TaxID=57666 RepID=UPI0004691AA2|nr:hypothetical protein [Sulfurospirillum arcachonense]
MNNIIKIIIISLITVIAYLGYSLLTKDSSVPENQITKEQLNYAPKKIDTKKTDETLGKLNQELEKTEKMLQKFHKTDANKKVKLTQKEEADIKKLQLQIEQVKKTINNISEKTN